MKGGEAEELPVALRAVSGFPRRRLAAEEIRDSLLFVAGLLDTTMHGTLLSLKPRQYVNDAKTGKHLVGYDNLRRSVYQPVIRNKVYSLFQTFEFPSPSLVAGRRATTTVPPQMLVMMNSDLVARCSRGWRTESCVTVPGPSRTKSGWPTKPFLDGLRMPVSCSGPGDSWTRSHRLCRPTLARSNGNVKCGRRSARP
ncbi:MAG: hypothetical protein Ct9H300mP1_38080 [Planctomycetaceae bacterium]|nr:MAG: hypothetical protein Ct9H300mP1_38080 [Planctomycetaceae bacterium]